MVEIKGGVCAAKGFTAAGVHCGIRKNKNKKDLALIFSEQKCAAACVYTQNLVKGAPLVVTKSNLANGIAQAIICNSGNANTCNADGQQVALKMCELVQKHLGIDKNDVVVASTGVIGQPLPIEPIQNGMQQLVRELGPNSSDAAMAIMTTDTRVKEIAFSFEISGKTCHIGGIAKGSGMIHPNMATMLVFITTDVAISHTMLQSALSSNVKDTFNMISIDGDTSTNDMVCVLANGAAGNATIIDNDKDYELFKDALDAVATYLCREIARDGEGATKLLECRVSGAKDKKNAKLITKSVISSTLFKCAMFGKDANWGRILCAIGYSGAELDVESVGVTLSSSAGSIEVCKNGSGLPFDEDKASLVLGEDEIIIDISLKDGSQTATAWGCDMSYDYIKINGDYRT